MRGQKSGIGQRVYTNVTASTWPRQSENAIAFPDWSVIATDGTVSPGCRMSIACGFSVSSGTGACPVRLIAVR